MMARVCILLLLLVVGSALYLVHVRYQLRGLVTTLSTARYEERQMAATQRRLQAEVRVKTAPLQVQQRAYEKLRMIRIGHDVTLYIADDGQVIKSPISIETKKMIP